MIKLLFQQPSLAVGSKMGLKQKDIWQVVAKIQAWFAIKAKAIKKRVRNESHGKDTGYPDHRKREKESRDVMGSWGSYPWKQDIQEDGSSQDIELDFKFPVSDRFCGDVCLASRENGL